MEADEPGRSTPADQRDGLSWNGIHPALREAVIAALVESRAKQRASALQAEALSSAMMLAVQSILVGQGGDGAEAVAVSSMMEFAMANGAQLANKLMDQAFLAAIDSLSYGLTEAWAQVNGEAATGG